MGFFDNLFGGGGASASRKAAEALQRGTTEAMDLAQQQREVTNELLNPMVEGGARGFDMQQALAGTLGPEAQAEAFSNFQESPGQQFLRDQGMRGIEQNLGASGRGGGTRLEAISKFNQGLAQQDFQNQFSRVQQVAGVGERQAGNLAQLGETSAQQQAARVMEGAGAESAGILAEQNARAGGVSNLLTIGGGVIGAMYGQPALGATIGGAVGGAVS